MTPIEKDKIFALCEKWGLKELNITKGVFMAEDNSGITVNLRGDNPIVGVTIAGQLYTEGHGNLKVEDYQREVEAIMKSKTSRSSSTEHSEKQPLRDRNRNPNQKLKLGTPDNIVPPGPTHSGKLTKIKVCMSCGLELSGARALECFQKDPQKPVMICEECEDKFATKGDKIMDEKLPTTINENKLTVNLIKQYICPAATDAEAYNFLQLCVHRDLNPFLKEAYLIKYGSAPATMVVGKDAFTKKAEESGKLDGFEAGIIVLNKDKQVERRVGVVQFEGDILVGGWAKVFRKDMKYPFVCEVPLTEYMKYKDGNPQSSWATLPGTMIRKVALVQSLREAFTAELGGCYDAVEMGTEDK